MEYPPSPTRPANSASRRIEAVIFRFLNDERRNRGLNALQWDKNLARLALAWSKSMATTGEFKHRDIAHALLHLLPRGRYQGLGENIFMADAALANAQWAHGSLMRSDHHRSNIVQPGFNYVGMASWVDRNGRLWLTQNFGRGYEPTLPPMTTAIPSREPIVHDRPPGGRRLGGA